MLPKRMIGSFVYVVFLGVVIGCGTQVSMQFPLPASVQNLTSQRDGASANFQTSWDLQRTLQFYREAFVAQGLQENTALTKQDNVSFSIVFTGHASGRSIVVQAVVVDPHMTNVTIRFGAR